MTARSAKQSQKAVPYYQQVANILRTSIAGGDDTRPVRLPPDGELCTIHEVSLITIRKAMDLLKQEGLVRRAPGRGTLTIPEAIRQWKRMRQSRLIHVLTSWQHLPAIPGTWYGQIYQGILQRCEQAGYRLSVQELAVPRTSMSTRLELPQRDLTAGIIFIGMMNETMIRLYTDAGYPVVCVDYYTTNPQADAVVVDCYGEGQAAADFLLRQGHRDMFYVGNAFRRPGSPAQNESDAELLLAGLQRALGLAGQPPVPPERVRFCDDDPGHAPAIGEWFLSMRPRPTAGVVFTLRHCQLLMQYLYERRIRCPEDISLITKGYEGEATDIACLRGDAWLLGQLAIEALLERVAGHRTTGLRLAAASRLSAGRTIRQLATVGSQLAPQSRPTRAAHGKAES